MAKNKQAKRMRSFKVHSDANGIPFVRFGGKYLSKELGLTCGDRLELIHDNDMLTLRKFSTEEIEQYETTQKEKTALSLIKKLLPVTSSGEQAPVMMVAENSSSTYSVEEEISRHLERYSQAKKSV